MGHIWHSGALLQCHDVYSKFYENLSTGSKTEMSGEEHSHIHNVVIPKAYILSYSGKALI
jgi:hypothetical protein